MKKLLLVGGTGFLGFHIAREAKKRGYKITSLSLKKPKKKRFIKGVKYIRADISSLKILKAKVNSNFEYIINAGGYGIHPKFGKSGDELIKSHYSGLKNLIEILSKKKIKRFVQIGSSAEYGKVESPINEKIKCYPNTPYAIAKNLCTNFLLNLYEEKKFPVTILRLFQVYGPHQDKNRVIPFLITNCLKDNRFPTTSGNQLCDFIHVDDVVSAIFKCVSSSKAKGEIFNIGTGKTIKIKKLITYIQKNVGKGKPIIGKYEYKKGTNMKHYPNIKKAKKLLLWEPKIKFLNGLKRTIEIYNE